MHLYTGNNVDVLKYVGSIAPLSSQQTQILNKRADKSFNLEDLE